LAIAGQPPYLNRVTERKGAAHMMKISGRDVLVSGLGRAARGMVTLLPLGAAALAALALQSWALLGLGAAAYGGILVLQMSRRSFWRAVMGELRRRPPPWPAATELRDPDGLRLATRLTSARRRRQALFEREAPAGARVLAILEDAADLERAAVALLLAIDRVGRHLAGEPPLEEGVGSAERRWLPPQLAQLEEVRSAEMSGCRAAAVRRLAARRATLLARLEANVRALEAFPSCLMEGELEAQLALEEPARDEVFRTVLADVEAMRPEEPELVSAD
jgi:hypothetical protein